MTQKTPELKDLARHQLERHCAGLSSAVAKQRIIIADLRRRERSRYGKLERVIREIRYVIEHPYCGSALDQMGTEFENARRKRGEK